MPFNGFPKECVEFYEGLNRNNSKAWFDKHKDDYENFVLTPARDFVVEMGKHLRKLSPGIHADPRVNKSLFKIHRDVRFSKDKRPFKTNLGIFFWQGEGKRFDCSGFYFHLAPPEFMLAAGIHVFDPKRLKFYREQVVHETHGPALDKAINKVRNAGYDIIEKHYKKVPRGYDKDHKYAEYLLFNGLNAYRTMLIPDEFFTPKIINFSLKAFKGMNPVHKWLVDMTERSAK